ncbi:MAG: hypothetical protein R3F62_22400 [Planctomycetota bacterium]
MARRISSFLVLALGASFAQADVIWLRNDPEIVKEVGNRLDAPHRLFEADRGRNPDGTPRKMFYIRGRIVDVDPTELDEERLLVQPWTRRDPNSRLLVFAEPIWISIRSVQDIEHEFDSFLDMEFMFSSRKNFASKRWKERVQRLLDPTNELELNRGPLPPKETEQELAEVRLDGWLPFLLRELVATPPPEAMTTAEPRPGETHEEMLARLRTETAEEDLQRFRPAFHPFRHVMSPQLAVRRLLEGAAVAGSYREELEKDLERRYPDPDDRSKLDFPEQCRFAVGFLCALAKIPAPPALDPEGKPIPQTYDNYLRRHFRQIGRFARAEVIAILEEGAPGASCYYDHFRRDAVEEVEGKLDAIRPEVRRQLIPLYQSLLESKGGRGRLDPRSRLDPTPSELALEALKVVRNYPTWWIVQLNAQDLTEGVDPRHKRLLDAGELPPTAESTQLITALIHLAQRRPGVPGYPSDPDDPPLPDPRSLDGEDLRDDVQLMAEATLSGLLLPVGTDGASGAWRMPLDTVSPAVADMATKSARAFRMALEPLFYTENPAVQEVLTQPLINVVGRLDLFSFPGVLDNLFATMNHELEPDPTASKFEVRRERRKRAYAARLILILASQAGPDDGSSLEASRLREFGNQTVERLLALRVSRASGEISPGERRLDDAIQNASQGDSELGERARIAEAEVERQRQAAEDTARDELAQAQEAYAGAQAAKQAAAPDLNAVQREALDVEVGRTRRELEAVERRLKLLLAAKR